MPAATANAVRVWPEGIETLCSSSPTTRICALSTTAAGRGLSIKNLPVRANSTAKGAAHSQATIRRGANTSNGAVTASRPHPLPNKDKPVQNFGRHRRTPLVDGDEERGLPQLQPQRRAQNKNHQWPPPAAGGHRAGKCVGRSGARHGHGVSGIGRECKAWLWRATRPAAAVIETEARQRRSPVLHRQALQQGARWQTRAHPRVAHKPCGTSPPARHPSPRANRRTQSLNWESPFSSTNTGRGRAYQPRRLAQRPVLHSDPGQPLLCGQGLGAGTRHVPSMQVGKRVRLRTPLQHRCPSTAGHPALSINPANLHRPAFAAQPKTPTTSGRCHATVAPAPNLQKAPSATQDGAVQCGSAVPPPDMYVKIAKGMANSQAKERKLRARQSANPAGRRATGARTTNSCSQHKAQHMRQLPRTTLAMGDLVGERKSIRSRSSK